MAAPPTLHPEGLLSIEEYLDTRYRPDCDFVDGRIEHRRPPEGFYTEQEMKELFVGEYEHNRLQILIGSWFLTHESEWPINAVTEQRIQVSRTRIRVCDVCLLRADAPRERVIESAPLLCLEIMSPTDRLSRARVVLDDYRTMGVSHIWLINPFTRKAWVHGAAGLVETSADRMQIPASPIFLPLAELLAKVF